MIEVIASEKYPIKSWVSDLEDGALAQAKNLANLPFIHKHIALMPDCHQGYGMPIGGVMATQGVVIPNAVGVDIGCGMYAVQTPLESISREQLLEIMSIVRSKVPVGFKHQTDSRYFNWLPEKPMGMPVVDVEFNNAKNQVGTLGGGNHFIEIQMGDNGKVWFMIHSGSRNLGYKVAKHYNELAVKLNKKWYSSVPKKHELAFLPLDSEEGRSYLREMNYCVDFALRNRELMAEQIKTAFVETMGEISFFSPVNIAHNYAAMEHHFNQNVMVHRKGATRARKLEAGIIPGSQGTASYIVEGLGNPDGFMSCSHGAGRRMGRKQAQRELSFKGETERLEKQGIIHSIRSEKDLDEAAGAYKDIAEVMANQTDLVKIVHELKPLAVIKG